RRPASRWHNPGDEARPNETWPRRRPSGGGRSRGGRGRGAPRRGVPTPARPRDVGGSPDIRGPSPRGDHGPRLLGDTQGGRARGVLPAGRRRLTLVLASSAIVIAVLALVGFGPGLAARLRRR